MARPQSRYLCQACGASTLRWEGQCRSCDAWNTLVETIVREPRAAGNRSPGPGQPGMPVALAALRETELRRTPTGIVELDRVLGGGFIPGSLVLLGGEPGIGKSTLGLEAAAGLVADLAPQPGGPSTSPKLVDPTADLEGRRVLYVSGEESVGQLRLRAGRVGVDRPGVAEQILVLAETRVEAILAAAEGSKPDLVVVDSVQTLTVDDLDGPAGSVGQVREVASRLQAYAKHGGVPVVLVGHVTKDGSLAGPKTLEHLVDVVLTLEGERLGPLRVLRASKNRFGSTDEIGVFEMVEAGLREVSDPARAFLGERGDPAPGASVAACLEGRRPLLIEVQALVTPAGYGAPRRVASGIDVNRLSLLVAVLAKRAGVGLGSHDIYASLAGGLSISERGLDLPLALALASSLRDRPARPRTVACGELGLLGELRPVSGLDRRLREAQRLGFTRAVIPAGESSTGRGSPGDLEVVAVGTIRDALDAALAAPIGAARGG